METYLIQSGLALTSFYLIYWLLIRHRQNFGLNRFYILLSIIFAGILPLLEIPFDWTHQPQLGQALEPIIISGIGNETFSMTTNSSYSIFSIVYIIGLMVFTFRTITGLATLSFYYWRYPRVKHHDFTAVILPGQKAPFTFFNLLFICQADLNKGQINELIVHEKVHRDHYHSVDLILMEVFASIHWFNPIIWLFKKDLKSEHEFMADEQVIDQGFDKSRYQSLLLKTNEGMALYLANNFNYSILKKRLAMMTKQKSNRKSMNYLTVFPVMLLTASILFFNFQINGQNTTIPDVFPEYKTGNKDMYVLFQKNIKYPIEARKSHTEGTVYVSFTVSDEGTIQEISASKAKYNLMEEIVVVAYKDGKDKVGEQDLSILEEECERLAKLLGDFNPGTKDGKAISTKLTIPVTFKLSPSK
jgi:hypothetical protein